MSNNASFVFGAGAIASFVGAGTTSQLDFAAVRDAYDTRIAAELREAQRAKAALGIEL